MTSVSYKQFGQNKELTLTEYKDFYFKKFPNALMWYYPSLRGDIILHAARKFNADRRFEDFGRSRDYSSTEQYYISASTYFFCLIPYVIEKIVGCDARDLFYKASSWPKMSAGLAGYVSPEQWLFESELLPLKGREASCYNDLLDIILPFHCSEIEDFFKGGQLSANKEAYDSLCLLVTDKIDVIIEEIKHNVQLSKERFLQGKYNVNFS